ncbi:MAG: LysE family translocator [Robiginitomaculum sp.]|nr:LysE family translocator [Robiginitomaculum sp.]
MIEWTMFGSLIGLVFVASITPGPNNFMLMSSGALFGFKRSLPHILGVTLGFPALLIATVYGLGAIIERLPWLVTIVKTIGAAWLAWMAIKFFIEAKRIALAKNNTGISAKPTSRARPFRFYEAALFQWANPKAVIMALTTSGAFVPLSPNIHMRALLITSVFIVFALLATSVWTLAGSTLNRAMSQGRSAVVLNIVMGVLLLGTAAVIFMTPT